MAQHYSTLMVPILTLLCLAACPAALAQLFPISVLQPASATLLPQPSALAAELRAAAAAASAAGSLLLVLPELFASGYAPTALEGQPRGGPAYAAAAALAREFNISLLYTYSESAGGRLYDAAALFNRSGAALLDYRKVNLAGDGEALVFAPGEAIAPVVELDGLRVGVLICFDIFLPEPARLLALQGADLILVPTANGYPGNVYNQLTELIVPARALENNCFVVYCNWWQARTANTSDFPPIFSFFGQSTVSDPGGGLVWRGPSDGGALAHLQLNLTGHSRGSTAQGRPPADYAGLCSP